MEADADGEGRETRKGERDPVEAALVRRAQRGDREAFDALYDLCVGRVYAVCLRMVGDREAAERLTQDTFVLAWRRLTSFRGDAAFTTWLHRLTVNTVLQDARAARRRADHIGVVSDAALEGRTRGRVDPGLRIDLERAVAVLPAGARTALVLHDIEGYKLEEIARLTGSALGTVKSQLHRARRLLRKALER